jgi:hypothetical protein
MTNQETSIEWLFNLTNEGYWDSLDAESKQKAFKLAMDKHKHEIIKAWLDGVTGNSGHSTAEGWYNLTYGGSK